MAPTWKGKEAEAEAVSCPISKTITQLQSCLIHSDSQATLSGTELAKLVNDACFGQPITVEKDKQRFQLSLEEAFFLCYSLKCLKIVGEGSYIKDSNQLWDYMVSVKETSPAFYKAYSHLRMKNWVVRSGSQYGVDFVAYRHHPSLVHSEYAVLVLEEVEGNNVSGRLKVWSDIYCTLRLCVSVSMTLLVLHVTTNGKVPTSPSCLESYVVQERTITGWNHPQSREERGLPFKTLVAEDSDSQQGVSKKMSLINGARRHLEWGHEKYVREIIQSHLAQAALGGVVGKIQRIYASLRIRLRDYGVLDYDAGDARRQPHVDTTWQHDTNDEEVCYSNREITRKDTCKACWKDELGLAEIVSSKGRLLTTIGIVRKGKIYCSIEETLYMAELGALHLLRNDLCLSLDKIYERLSQERYGCSLESFKVYRHLKSLGYIVSRHGVSWTPRHITKNESKLNEATTKTNLKGDSEYEDTCVSTESFKSVHIDKVKPVFDVYAPNNKFRKSSPGNPNFVLCLTSGHLPPSKQEIIDLEKQCNGIPLKLCNVEHDTNFFSFNAVELPILP